MRWQRLLRFAIAVFVVAFAAIVVVSMRRGPSKPADVPPVKKLDPKGQKFDPNFHQAIFEAPDETVPSGTVAQVVQTGWTIGDRVLRPAMVGVSKGGPKAAPKEQPVGNGD